MKEYNPAPADSNRTASSKRPVCTSPADTAGVFRPVIESTLLPRGVTVLMALLLLVFASCSNGLAEPSGSDESPAPVTQLPDQVPDPPQYPGQSSFYDTRVGDAPVSRHGNHTGTWLGAARKYYLELFFAFLEHESPLVGYFFPHYAELILTSYDPQAVPLAGTYNGRFQISEYFRQLFNTMDIHDIEVQYQLAQDPYVSSHVRLRGRFKDSGTRVDMEFVFLFQFGEEGSITKTRVYYDTQLWTRAHQTPSDQVLQDIQHPGDDFRIRPTDYDLTGLVDQLYANFYAGDIPGVMAMLSPDAAVYFKGDQESYPYAGIYEGQENILQFIQNLAGTAQPYNIQMFQVSEGNRSDVVLFEEWTVFATGKSYHVHTVNSWDVDAQGRLGGFYNYPDSQEIAQAYIP
ncbi:nuclear transport factor 2 family protein [Spirochaeta lutea]|uniref:SnoaL-like domain-containing protein n=1 Tax=Spirochaeta lutea TaxID=1480694 RepID=A0A098R2A0_9SPIO|nr:nuclear transport factor 2 family protein [Spirochaeta lutea]KGE73891.1 hypothetical protein DC28_01435 [Spirochaeta lutea]